MQVIKGQASLLYVNLAPFDDLVEIVEIHPYILWVFEEVLELLNNFFAQITLKLQLLSGSCSPAWCNDRVLVEALEYSPPTLEPRSYHISQSPHWVDVMLLNDL